MGKEEHIKVERISVSEIHAQYCVLHGFVRSYNIYEDRTQDLLFKSKVRSIIKTVPRHALQNLVAVHKTIIKTDAAKTLSPIEVRSNETSKAIDFKVMKLLPDALAPIFLINRNRYTLSKLKAMEQTLAKILVHSFPALFRSLVHTSNAIVRLTVAEAWAPIRERFRSLLGRMQPLFHDLLKFLVPIPAIARCRKGQFDLFCTLYNELMLAYHDLFLKRSSKELPVPDAKSSELAAGQIYRVKNIFQRSSRYYRNSLAHFVNNTLYVYKVEVRSYLEEARKLMLDVINNARNAAKKYFIENYNVIAMGFIDVENKREDLVNQSDWLMMLDSLLKKKHLLLLPFGFLMDEEKPTLSVISAAGSDDYFQSMLLKMLKRDPQEMLESFQSEVTEYTSGGGKRINRLTRVTKEIRAKMRFKTEELRAGWGKGSDDEC